MPQPQEKLYTSDEFAMMTDLPAGTQLINGKIVYPNAEKNDPSMSAAPSRKHQEISGGIFVEILNYIRTNNGKCKVYPAPFDVRLTDDTTVEPDISVICNTDNLTENGMNGCPDWIIEILSPSSIANDLYYKKNLYFENGIREYWIVDPMKDRVTVMIENSTVMYSFEDKIPVGIYDGKLMICIDNVMQ